MSSAPETRHLPTVVLVTGGAGFIGSNFLLRMVSRYPDTRFINLDALTYAGNLMNLTQIQDAENYAFVHGSVTDQELVANLFAENDVSTVVHFAAESHVDRSILDPLEFVRTNTLGTTVLLDAARRAWKGAERHRRFYHVSTDEVFGSLGDDGFFSETTPYDPRSPYSASKAASDHFVRAYGHTYGLPFVISNCSNNYGPYQFPEKLISLAILNALQEKEVPVYGEGRNVRDWLFVGDHCEAIDLILRRGENGETYVIGGGAERMNIELVQLLLDVVDEVTGRPAGTGRDLIRFVRDRPGHDFRYAMDYTRLRTELGWQPGHTLEEGLRETVRWYIENQDWLEAVNSQAYREYYDSQYGSR